MPKGRLRLGLRQSALWKQGVSISTFGYRHGHFDPFEGVIPAIALHVHHFVRHLHSADHFTKYRVLPIERIRVRDADKELGSSAVWVIRSSHGQYSTFVGLAVELGLDLVPRPPHPVRCTVSSLAVGVTALNHEIRNDPMEGCSVVESLSRQVQKVFHMPRRHIGK